METTIPFHGFYDSFHSHELDNALEQIFSDSSGNPIDGLVSRAFDKVDWGKAHLEYAKVFAEAFALRFGLKTLKFAELSSPKYYNFETDRIFCTIDESEVKMMFDTVDKQKLNDRIHERFTSRSGFISFYKNDLEDWKSDVTEWDINEVGTLLEVYIQSHEEYTEEYEYYLLDDVYSSAYEIVSDCVTDSRLFKIGDYLREREERQFRR